MLKRLVFLSVALGLYVSPAWCQVEPSASGGGDDSNMSMPSQVSGSFFPSEVGSQARSNYISGGVLFSAGYNDNVLVGNTSAPISAETYMILPSVSLEQSTTRTSASLQYSPGFTFYDPISVLNSVNQNLAGEFTYRTSPHTTLSAQEVFQQNSTVFNQPYTLSGATISAGSLAPIIILPYADQVTDSTNVHFGYQFSRSSMIGASGSFSLFNFNNSNQNGGLVNSRSEGGSGFYSRRLGRAQFFGATYGYSRTDTNPYPSTAESHSASFFYSVSPQHNISVSFSGGPQYITISAPGTPAISSLAPNGSVSLGLQKSRANIVASYSRAVSTGWGLLGAYTTDSGTISLEVQLARRLFGGVSGNYSDVTNELLANVTQSGHTIFGRAALRYQFAERLSAVAEYSRLHENYGGVAEVVNDPDADRIAISLNYQFRRPLGR